MKIPPSITRYWLAMNASAFDAAVHSSVAFFGVAGAHAAIESIPALNLQQFAAVFLITFGRAILAYLDAHPLSSLIPDAADALDRRTRSWPKTELIKTPGDGGNATGASPAEPTAVPAPSTAALPLYAVQETYHPPTP
jgi:hypothetical protein